MAGPPSGMLAWPYAPECHPCSRVAVQRCAVACKPSPATAQRCAHARWALACPCAAPRSCVPWAPLVCAMGHSHSPTQRADGPQLLLPRSAALWGDPGPCHTGGVALRRWLLLSPYGPQAPSRKADGLAVVRAVVQYSSPQHMVGRGATPPSDGGREVCVVLQRQAVMERAGGAWSSCTCVRMDGCRMCGRVWPCFDILGTCQQCVCMPAGACTPSAASYALSLSSPGLAPAICAHHLQQMAGSGHKARVRQRCIGKHRTRGPGPG